MKFYNKITMLVVLLTVLTIADISFAMWGTTGMLTGKITDKSNGLPLVGVNVVIANTYLGGSTDINGEYKIFNIPVGRHTVEYSYIGYKKMTIHNISINADITTVYHVNMEVGSLELDEIVVTAEREQLKKGITGTSHVIEAKQIENLPVDNIADILATQPGVTRDLHIRGGRATEILYLVDGLPYTENNGGDVGGLLPKSAVGEVKILTGGFDAEYGNALSGVVNIVTKRGTVDKEFTLNSYTDRVPASEETDHEIHYELTTGGSNSNGSFLYFGAGELRTSDTRWWQDFRNDNSGAITTSGDFISGPILKEYSFVGKLEKFFKNDVKIYTQFLASSHNSHDYEFRWRRNLDGLPERERKSFRVSIGLSQFISERAFYNIQISHFTHNSSLGSRVDEPVDRDDLFQYDFLLQYVTSGRLLWWADEKQSQTTFKADFTSQYSDRNSLKMGGEFIYYDMDIERVKYEPQLTYYGKPRLDVDPVNYSSAFNYKPFSGSAFIQNKLRFVDDGTMSVGLRWDFLNPRAQRPAIEWVEIGDGESDIVAEWTPATIKHQISPRFGFAMPASPDDFFFVNLGYFFQMPLFEQLYSGLDINLKKNSSVLVGNPDMKPQVTRAYEFSYRRKLDEESTLTLTVFDKQTENLVDTKTFLASDSKALDDGFIAQYVNSPYANARGLEATLVRDRIGKFKASVSYTLMITEGASETAEDELNYIQWGFSPERKLYPLSWDQRHTINGVFNVELPWDLNSTMIVNYHSPRPYTYYPSPDGFETPQTVIQPNNKRMQNNLYLDLKASKKFNINSGINALTIYTDIRNILDRENVLWMSSDGSIGGELGDPGAYDMPRRARVGIKIDFK